jgi:hypothetical protein
VRTSVRSVVWVDATLEVGRSIANSLLRLSSFSETKDLWNKRLSLPAGDLETLLIQALQENDKAWGSAVKSYLL